MRKCLSVFTLLANVTQYVIEGIRVPLRDRDRLRQEVLERLRWTIYRIWSTDWFRNPNAEVQKLVEVIEELRRMPQA